MPPRISTLAGVLLACFPVAARADALALDDVLAFARAHAPRLRFADALLVEAEARVAGAGVLFDANPVAAGAVGRRRSGSSESIDFAVDIEQRLPLAGGRGARVDAADAAVEAARAHRRDAERLLVQEATQAFVRVLHARARREQAELDETATRSLASIVTRRVLAGDGTALEQNLARAELARRGAERLASRAHEDEMLWRLHALVGASPATRFDVRGNLVELVHAQSSVVAGVDPTAADARRADLQALQARAREASAEVAARDAGAWPELQVGLSYEREERANILMGKLGMTLPVWNRDQGERGAAVARQALASASVEAARHEVVLEQEAARNAAALALEALDLLEREGVPPARDNERLAEQAFGAGELGLADVLAVRRHSIEVRQEALDSALEAAVALINLRAAHGDPS